MNGAATIPTAEAVASAAPFRYDGQLTIAVNVSDFESAIAWYREALGFQLVYKLDDYEWCELQTPIEGVSVGLGRQEQTDVGGSTPVFGVVDIDEARASLESRGVSFDGETSEVARMVKLATFRDPDGNGYMLAQTLAPAGGAA